MTCTPLLESDGNNWAVFSQKFKWHLEGLGLNTHFSRENYLKPCTEEEPKQAENKTNKEFETNQMEWKTKLLEWRAANKEWIQEEGKAKSQLASAIPNSIFIECCQYTDFIDMWEFIETHFEKTTWMQKSVLKGKLNTMYCSEKSDIKTHLADMEGIYQQLASRNVYITDEEYCDTIMRSLPHSYQTIASNLDTILEYSNVTMTPAILKDHILKEYETRLIRQGRPKGSNDVAFAASSSRSHSGRGQ